MSVAGVSVSVTDDDSPGVRVSPERLRIAEGRSGSYNVRLNTEPAADVTINVSSDNDDVTVSPEQLTFTADNWNAPQTVTVSAADDPDAAEDEATLRHEMSSADPDYNRASNASVDVTVTDPDRPGVTVGPLSPSPLFEGQHPSYYTVRLDTQPTGNVVINLKSNKEDKVTVSPATLTFTPSNWVETVTVTAADDDDKDDEKATITHKVSASASADEYDEVSIRNLDVTVADNDDDGVTLIQTGPLVVSEGVDGPKTATYQVVLDSRPDGTVTIVIETSNPDKVEVEPAWLIFDGTQFPNNPVWDEPQTITVTALDDGDGADETVTLTHRIVDANATAGTWDVPIGARVGTVTVTVSDDDGNATARTAANRAAGVPESFTLAPFASLPLTYDWGIAKA